MKAGLPASRLDHISLIAERPERPLDFAALVRLGPDAPSAAALSEGALSAYRAFPRTTSRLTDDRWVPMASPVPEVVSLADQEALRSRVEAEVETRLDPRAGAPLQELILECEGRAYLLVRCHHAAADGLSLLWWVDHQLRVARGAPPAPDLDRRAGGLELSQHESPRRKNHFAHAGASRTLWRRGAEPSRRRRVLSLELDADRIRAKLGPRGSRGFSYNDLLAAAALLAAEQHQREHGAPTDRLSLWFPVDIRATPFVGFGNGASRVRIYHRDPGAGTVLDLAQRVRAQLEAARAEGEWFVPTDHPLFSMPDWVVLAYLRRPWVDMGSLLYSHVERPSAVDTDLLPGAEAVETIATLDRRHPIGLAAVTLRGRTHVSFTWDPEQLFEEDVTKLIEFYTQALCQAEEALTACVG